jgi:large subunit ribosomal protein L4
MKVKVQSLDAKAKAGDIELNDAIFGVEPRADILHRVVTWQLEKRRAPTRATRERCDVARTGKKFGRPEGRRHRPSRRSPRSDLRRRRQGARRPRPRLQPVAEQEGPRARPEMALSAKAKGGNLIVLDTLDLKEAKTAGLKEQLGKLGLRQDALVIDGDALNVGFAPASANLARSTCCRPSAPTSTTFSITRLWC